MHTDIFSLFFAVFPDRQAAAKIEQLATELRNVHDLKGKPVAVDRFHVSLHHLGFHDCMPAAIVKNAERAAAEARGTSFGVTFNRIESFKGQPNRHPFVLSGDAGLKTLREFHQRLGVSLKKTGLGRYVSFSFTPHLTLLRGHRLIEEHPVVPAIGWNVKEFSLVWSHYGKSRHEVLGAWPLCEAIA